MSYLENIEPYEDERPSVFAGRLAEAYMAEEGKDPKLHFTPLAVAQSLASKGELPAKKLSLLEPACGTAILSCAQLEYWAGQKQKPTEVHLRVFEKDFTLLALAEKALRYLKSWMKNHKIRFEYQLTAGDFIMKNTDVLRGGLFASEHQNYDMILTHPPVQRITQVDPWGQALQAVGYSVPDAFAAFLSISMELLKPNGKLSVVLPRKFAYSALLKEYRLHFFRQLAPEHIQLTDGPEGLAAHLILAGEKREDFHNGKTFSLSQLGEPAVSQWQLWELLNLRSQAKMLALPANAPQSRIYKESRKWTCRLQDLGINMGSGKIENRQLKQLRTEQEAVAFLPFGKCSAARDQIESQDVQTYLGPKAVDYAVPDQDYILLRARGRKSGLKIQAAYYKKGTAQAEYIALDKNSLCLSVGHLAETEIWGILAYLNSDLLLHFITTYKGNKAPSPGEWKEIPFPDREALSANGKLYAQKDKMESMAFDYSQVS